MEEKLSGTSPAFAGFLSRKPHAGAQMQDGCLQYLRGRFPNDPPGYNRALEFVSNEGFDDGLSLLIAQIRQTNVKPIGNIRSSSILATELDPIFGEDKVRCVEVPDAWNHRILQDAAVPFDNRGKKLQKLLKLRGSVLKRQGEHEVWAKQGIPPVPVPRTKHVADGTAESILKKIDSDYRLRNFEQILRSAEAT